MPARYGAGSESPFSPSPASCPAPRCPPFPGGAGRSRLAGPCVPGAARRLCSVRGPGPLSPLCLWVEVLGRYSNLSDQGERLRQILEVVPEGPPQVNVRPHKRFQHRLAPEEIGQLKRAYGAGATLRDLARDFRIHRGTAAELLERSGNRRRGKGPSDDQMSEAIRMYEHGHSTASIGQKFGFAADTIRNRLAKAGVQMRGPHDWHSKQPSLANRRGRGLG